MLTPAPPYTQAEIALLRTPEERLRARAELSSYVTRLKRERDGRLAVAPGEPAEAIGNGAAARPVPTGPRSMRTQQQEYRFHPYQRPGARNSSQSVAQRSLAARGVAHGTVSEQTSSTPLCPAFTKSGYCDSHACLYVHDPTKQALCRHWLSNSCSYGDHCALSHQPSPNNAITCLYFMRGHCNKTGCRFAHVRIEPDALNCEQFGRLGYCEQGASCPEFHAYECATFSNTGYCVSGDMCQYGHVRRAGCMRQGLGIPTKNNSPMPRTPTVNSPSQPGTPAKISDTDDEQGSVISYSSASTQTLDHSLTLSRNASTQTLHLFSQQADYIPLED